MPELKLKNVQIESNGWKRSLSYMADENILMKTRLAEILQENFDLDQLPQMETFHSLLLKEEEFINLLRHSIAELDRHLRFESATSNGSQIDSMRSLLKHQMLTAEAHFNKLKSDFYDFPLRKKKDEG